MELIKQQFTEAQTVLQKFIENSDNFAAIEHAAQIMVNALKTKHKLFSCGNGGSMSDAMHFAEELTGRFRNHREAIAAIAIADASHITCVANDYGFEHIFSRYVEAVGNEGDVLLAISTSGNSPNVLAAAKAALAKGMKVVALTGKDGGELARNCSVEIRVAHFGFSDRVQEIHIKVIHTIILCIENQMVNA